MTDYDLIIIGSGPAGLSAGIYAGRYRLKTLIIGKTLGGQASVAGEIWNYPGVKGKNGYEIAKIMREQAGDSGVEIVSGEVADARKIDGGFEVILKGKKITSRMVILATGGERRKLGLPNEEELLGKGVHYCATCDAPLYEGKTIAFVGGGNASVKGAIMAAEYAKKIYMIVREKEFMAEPALVEELNKRGKKIETLFESEVGEIVGAGELEKVILKNGHGKNQELELDGLFIEIGMKPNSEIAQKLGVEVEKSGHVVVDNYMKTNIDGVFAAGDMVSGFKDFAQIVIATATGSLAGFSAYKYSKIS